MRGQGKLAGQQDDLNDESVGLPEIGAGTHRPQSTSVWQPPVPEGSKTGGRGVSGGKGGANAAIDFESVSGPQAEQLATAGVRWNEMKRRFAHVRKRNMQVANALAQVNMFTETEAEGGIGGEAGYF